MGGGVTHSHSAAEGSLGVARGGGEAGAGPTQHPAADPGTGAGDRGRSAVCGPAGPPGHSGPPGPPPRMACPGPGQVLEPTSWPPTAAGLWPRVPRPRPPGLTSAPSRIPGLRRRPQPGSPWPCTLSAAASVPVPVGSPGARLPQAPALVTLPLALARASPTPHACGPAPSPPALVPGRGQGESCPGPSRGAESARTSASQGRPTSGQATAPLGSPGVRTGGPEGPAWQPGDRARPCPGTGRPQPCPAHGCHWAKGTHCLKEASPRPGGRALPSQGRRPRRGTEGRTPPEPGRGGRRAA